MEAPAPAGDHLVDEGLGMTPLGWVTEAEGDTGATVGPPVPTPDGDRRTWRDLLAAATPYIFLIGLLVSLAYGIHRILGLWLEPGEL